MSCQLIRKAAKVVFFSSDIGNYNRALSHSGSQHLSSFAVPRIGIVQTSGESSSRFRPEAQMWKLRTCCKVKGSYIYCKASDSIGRTAIDRTHQLWFGLQYRRVICLILLYCILSSHDNSCDTGSESGNVKKRRWFDFVKVHVRKFLALILLIILALVVVALHKQMMLQSDWEEGVLM